MCECSQLSRSPFNQGGHPRLHGKNAPGDWETCAFADQLSDSDPKRASFRLRDTEHMYSSIDCSAA